MNLRVIFLFLLLDVSYLWLLRRDFLLLEIEVLVEFLEMEELDSLCCELELEDRIGVLGGFIDNVLLWDCEIFEILLID